MVDTPPTGTWVRAESSRNRSPPAVASLAPLKELPATAPLSTPSATVAVSVWPPTVAVTRPADVTVPLPASSRVPLWVTT
jgi:hypothetical protein